MRSSEKNYPIRVLCQPAGLSDKVRYWLIRIKLVQANANATHQLSKIQLVSLSDSCVGQLVENL